MQTPRAPGITDRVLGLRARGHLTSRRCVSRWSLLLKVWAAQREADGERPCLSWIHHISQLLEDDAPRMRGHRPTKQLLIDRVHQLGVIVDRGDTGALPGEHHGGTT